MLISGNVSLKRAWTFNDLEYMPRNRKFSINRNIRKLACEAWSKSEGSLSSLGPPPYAFVLGAAVNQYMGMQRMRDTDASMWISKRFLDGAQDMGIIPDDGPEIISSVTVLLPVVMDFGGDMTHTYVYNGAFVAPFLEPDWKLVGAREVEESEKSSVHIVHDYRDTSWIDRIG